MRDATLTCVSQRVPAPSRTFVASTGSSAETFEVNASPRDSTARSAAAAMSSSHAPGSSVTPLCATKPTSRFRSRAAIVLVQAAWTIAASSRGTTHSVRRIPSMRTSVRSS